jgi:hypothetical protein
MAMADRLAQDGWRELGYVQASADSPTLDDDTRRAIESDGKFNVYCLQVKTVISYCFALLMRGRGLRGGGAGGWQGRVKSRQMGRSVWWSSPC